jgi:hypothetical protein
MAKKRIHAPPCVWAVVASGLIAASCDDQPTAVFARDAGGRGGQAGARGVAEANGDADVMACDGTPLPMCEPGWTGPSCALPCDGEDCGFATYCHGDGRTWGSASFGAKLFPASASLPDAALHWLFEGFIVEHPEAVGLEAGVSPEDLDLVPARVFRALAGKLELLRFDQRYRGIPVYGPDGTVRVTLAPGGAIAFDGAIVDGRQVWANLDQHASEDAARRSILAHAAERSGLPEEEMEVAGLRRVAVPRVQRIGWVGTVRSGIGHVATIVVDADPNAGLPLPILHAEHIEAAGLVNEVDIGVLAEDPASDVFGLPEQTAGLGELFDGGPLRGSTRGTEVIVGTERVVGYDASGAMSLNGLNIVPPLVSGTAAFDAMPGTVAYDVQNHYVRAQSFYSFADRYMAGVWESLNTASSFPPGAFAPRVMLWIRPGFNACGDASFCVNVIPLEGMLQEDIAEEYEQPLGGPDFESLGYIAIETEGVPAHILAHEFGHIVDLFAAPYTIDAGLGCTGAPSCAPSCQLDTTEEAPTLREAVAQLFAIAATSSLYPVATFDNCDPLLYISLGDDGVPHSDACRSDGEPYSHFLPFPCPPGSTGFCDHEFDVGLDDMDQPTGLCGTSKGYRVDSVHQAFWEVFHGQSCAATPPYTCTPMTLPAGLSASDAFMPALLYGLRVDAKTFHQFVDAFATHVSCNLGADVYEEVNAVLCHHDLRACDAPPPAICEACGNGVREGGESCDGSDLGGASCQGLGFDGGVLACDASCMIDTAMCETTDTGLDDTGASDTMEPEAEVTSTDPSSGDATTSTSAGTNEGSDGCECSAGADRRGILAMASLGLVFGFVGARRRRQGRTSVSALAAVLVASSAQGCCDPTVASDTSSIGESSSTGDEASTDSTSVGESSTSAGESALPEWAIGVFSNQTDKVGVTIDNPLWYVWSNIEITASGAMALNQYSCSTHQRRQEFRWTLADDRQSLSLEPVPPSELFEFGSSSFISEIIVEPGASCDAIAIHYFHTDAMQWFEAEYYRGEVCATAADPDSCTFTFEWCNGEPPAPCE